MGFNEIIGQKEVLKFLKGSLKKGRIANAYLFYGPNFSGRFSTAIEFAKGLNCKEGLGIACDECPSCKKISKFEHPDVHLIFPPNKKYSIPRDVAKLREEGKYFKFLLETRDIGINTIRGEIIKEAYLTPFEGRKKVFIILNAERMTEEAANAFLKVLEEPPLNTVFILITTNPTLLLPTISSRTQWVRFRHLSKKNRNTIFKKFFGDKTVPDMISAEEISIFFDEDTNKLRKEIGELFFSGDAKTRVIRWNKPRALDIEVIIYILYLYIYDMIKIKLNMERIINKDYIDELRQVSERYTMEGIQNKIEILNESYQEYRHNVIPEEIMTNLMVRM